VVVEREGDWVVEMVVEAEMGKRYRGLKEHRKAFDRCIDH
jgi:hypothetical protein